MAEGKNGRKERTAVKGNRSNSNGGNGGNGNGNGNSHQFIIIGPDGFCTGFDGRIKALSYYGR